MDLGVTERSTLDSLASFRTKVDNRHAIAQYITLLLGPQPLYSWVMQLLALGNDGGDDIDYGDTKRLIFLHLMEIHCS